MEINLAPYQIKRFNAYVWLENIETGEQFFCNLETPSLLKHITKMRNKMNSAVGLNRLGI